MAKILIAESGATKTEWALKSGKETIRFRTRGINVAVMSPRDVLAVVDAASAELGERSAEVEKIVFYGAGLIGGDGIVMLDKVLKAVFPGVETAYGSDLLAAAKAGLGKESGIVAILGTGSNSAFYDGHYIVSNIRPGGFILGDEGGGAALGKAFISDFVKGQLPVELSERFRKEYSAGYAEIIKNVYGGPNPAGYLASFVPFILANRQHECVGKMVRDNFTAFVRRSLMQYDTERYPVAVVGSFGNECREELEAIGAEYGIRFSRFVPSPIEELIKAE